MKTVEEVLQKYTLGEAGKDETNDGLKELGSPLRLNPDRNVITPEELAETRVGETPAEANGWGILDHGVGRLCLQRRAQVPPAERCADGGRLMKTYIGTKIIQAEPAFRIDGEIYPESGPVPRSMNREEGYRVHYPDGYESWSPRDVFEEAYREIDGMNFGLAIEAAKKGAKITRRGWNGKGMWVVYRTGYPDGIPCNKNTAEAVGIPEGSLFKVRPYLQMKCVDGSFQMWLASQSDILADDWEIVEG